MTTCRALINETSVGSQLYILIIDAQNYYFYKEQGEDRIPGWGLQQLEYLMGNTQHSKQKPQIFCEELCLLGFYF